MTRKDYELLAKWAEQNRISRAAISDLCTRLYEQNPNFQQATFEERVQAWKIILVQGKSYVSRNQAQS